MRSDEVSHIHGHFINLRAIVLLDIAQDADVVILHEVDGHTLAAKPPRPPDPVNVQLATVWEIEVDHQRHLQSNVFQQSVTCTRFQS